jgi:SAM-dependent methyltransferase
MAPERRAARHSISPRCHRAKVWEPSGCRLLEAISVDGDQGSRTRSLDVGCGVLGWLRVLSEWVGPDGAVTGTDIDDAMLTAARTFVSEEGLGNVRLVRDDLFTSRLETASFDLVHSRFEVTPLGRGHEQMTTYLRLLRPGGTVVLEDPDWGSWHFNPPAPALEQLITLSIEAFRRWGDAEAGRKNPALLRAFGIEPRVRAGVLALPAGHPYLELPLQLAAGLEPRLREFTDASELQRLHRQAEVELAEPGRWGTTFTLLQCWGRPAA